MYAINKDRSVTHEIVTQPHFGSSIRHFAKKEAMERIRVENSRVCFASDTRNETLFIETNDPRRDKKMSRRGSKGKGRVHWQYFERTSAIRLLIHSLETRCFRRVRQ